MTTIDREYEYKPSWIAIIFNAVFFGGCAAVLGNAAAFNDRGRVFIGIINLSQDNATRLFWVLCALSIGFVAICALSIFCRLTLNQRIALTSQEIKLPKSRWSPKETAIQYSEIASIFSTKMSGQRFLFIYHTNGKRFTIAASHLPTKDSFDEVCNILQERLDHAKSNAS